MSLADRFDQCPFSLSIAKDRPKRGNTYDFIAAAMASTPLPPSRSRPPGSILQPFKKGLALARRKLGQVLSQDGWDILGRAVY